MKKRVTKDLIGKRLLGQRKMDTLLLAWYGLIEIEIDDVKGKYFKYHDPYDKEDEFNDIEYNWLAIKNFKIREYL